MKKYRFAIIGTGFWSRYQLGGWRELPNAECIAVYNRTRSKGEAFAKEFQIDTVYDDAELMLQNENLDFVDIIAGESVHEQFVALAAKYKLPVICQKPIAPDLSTARKMMKVTRDAGVPLFINENWRWQRTMRALKDVIDSGVIGTPWRARVIYNSSFPVFDNQPFLKELDHFVLMDVGTHLLDAVRFLFGEIDSLYCRTHKVHKDINGEDAATLLMGMDNGMTVNLELSYTSRWSGECFPQTLCLIEGENASVELLSDYRIRVTSGSSIEETSHPPAVYSWMDTNYGIVHSSIVDCQRNILLGMEDPLLVETRIEENLKTFEAVWAAYESAQTGDIVKMSDFSAQQSG